MKHYLELSGCSPVPLAHYLKALGILRVVAEQADDQAAGCWRRERFSLQSTLDKPKLIDFFLNQYAPTPIVAPWNGGSGFFPKKTAEAALNAIKNSESDRFEKYQDIINHAQSTLTGDDKEKFLSLQKDRKNSKKKAAWEKAKKLLQQRCRNTFPDHALKWIDAAYVLTEEGVKCPPLLGTGGNDGNLDFTNKFMQALSKLFDMNSGEPKKEEHRAALLQSLFAKNVPGSLTTEAKIGQFFPGSAGGVNTASGFKGKATVNLWDFILMLEGSLVFASASVKRFGDHSSSKLAYPFCVRQSSAGYASASAGNLIKKRKSSSDEESGSDEENSRAEMWMPLWNQPATLGELLAVFGEGRAQVDRRTARTGVDFARAAVTIGVDRGIAQFQRYGFLKRNGKYYFATPLDRIKVKPNSKANLLSEIDPWLSKLRAKANPKAKNAPASITRALLNIESRIFDLCKEETLQRLQNLLIALGQCERALSYSVKWALEAGIRPLAGTLSTNWLREVNTDTPEFRLARSLASTSVCFDKNEEKGFAFVQFMEPLKPGKNGFSWNKEHDPDVQWSRKNLVGNLNEVFSRQLVKITKSNLGEFPRVDAAPALLVDVVAFIEGRVDDALIENLVWGLGLINYDSRNPSSPSQFEQNTTKATGNELPPAIYSLMKLCFLPANLRGGAALDSEIPVQPQIHRQAALAANAEKASELAARRLLASGHPTLVRKLNGAPETTIRSAAALLFPIGNSAIRKIRKHVLQPKEEDE